MDLPFVNEVVFGEYYHGQYEVYSLKQLLNFVEMFAVFPIIADSKPFVPNHTASHRKGGGFTLTHTNTHTHTARINK